MFDFTKLLMFKFAAFYYGFINMSESGGNPVLLKYAYSLCSRSGSGEQGSLLVAPPKGVWGMIAAAEVRLTV